MIQDRLYYTEQDRSSQNAGEDERVFRFKTWLIVAFCLYSVWLLHLDSGSLTIFIFFLIPVALFFFVALSLSRSYQCVACPALVMNSCEVKAAPINAETIGIFPLSKQNTSGVLSLLAKRIFR